MAEQAGEATPRPRRRPFGAGGAFVIVLASQTLAQILGVVAFALGTLVVMLVGLAPFRDPLLALNILIDSPSFLLLATVPTGCVLTLVAYVVARMYGVPFARAVGWARPRLLPAMVALVFVFSAQPLTSAVAEAFHEAFPRFTLGLLDLVGDRLRRDAWQFRVSAVVSLAVFPPIAEELLFRGVLFGSMRARRGPLYAVLVSSLLFGLMHVEPVQVINAALLGVPLGIITWRTGSIVPAMIGHFVNNAAACVFAFSEAEATKTPPWLLATLGVLFVASGFLLFRLTRAPGPVSTTEDARPAGPLPETE